MAGNYGSQLLGNTGFVKLDATLSQRHHLSARLNTSRYYGANNVFFDPASPVTTFATSKTAKKTSPRSPLPLR